ncbi:MAG TPA: phosphate signaling complex protein PhoU [Paludibacteraceae bacterium]|jgi:phosphate transport system protein|nr:phosphate signaling complex protein PhoU [Paludibacteraceae bacterium]HOU67638.1 phosphate signaling complex protein PhoU [Paludibacteraceae bacterium]HPH62481.1 phosphate signaling complex protein PhoU [Paludibacteraceae bacterium]HQF49658.1 phosphate signaling complex protein PhoU [Paludibacteraceae bacterium]
MKHLEDELLALRDEVLNMWDLVYSQLEKAKSALLENNKELAYEVISREKRVNAFELMIDSDCENYIALYSPVAIDLRLVLSLLKINSMLERIGDFAEGIARFAIDTNNPRYENLIKDIQVEKLFDAVLEMLQDARTALENEDTKDAGRLFSQDDMVDDLYKQSLVKIAEFIKENPDCALDCIYLAILDRKLERIGDYCNNIVEEIVFYIDAKVMKHCGLKK